MQLIDQDTSDQDMSNMSDQKTGMPAHLPSDVPRQPADRPALGGAILAAALALPGVHLAAHAETAPEHGTISLKYLHYEDSQPGLDRISVRSPSIGVMAPIAGVWSIEGSLTSDDVSGASPHYHTAISGASKMQDTRTAGDVRVTRYFPTGTLSVGAAYSTEHDYVSRALSVVGSVSSDDKNRTWTFGAGYAHDAINPVNLIVTGERRITADILLGLTQVLTPQDIAQVNLTYAHGTGYFSDPYKYVDNRPRERNQATATLRWNHHFDGTDGTGRFSYRYYRDSFQIAAHTFGAEYVQPLQHGWTITPSARLYTQRAASFYFDPGYDPVFGAPFPPGYVFGTDRLMSADQRLSAYGARTIGIKVEKQLTRDLQVDVKFESYRQSSGMRLFGSGSPGLADFSARTIQIGLTKQW
jgi:hypothetical protein